MPRRNIPQDQIEIDLSELYGLSPRKRACDILYGILRNYDVDIRYCVNYSSDVGIEVFEITDGMGMVKARDNELLRRLEYADDIDDEIVRYAREKKLDIVKLYDGYEVATALVAKKSRNRYLSRP